MDLIQEGAKLEEQTVPHEAHYLVERIQKTAYKQ